MQPKPGHVYKNGDGNLVHIEGPTTNGEPHWWSLEGNHYNAEGRMVGREIADRYALVKEVGTHSDGGKGHGWSHSVCTVCTED